MSIAVWSHGQSSSVGKCTVKLPDEKFNDQAMKIMWKPLYDEKEKETPGRLKIGVQYVYDQTKLMETQFAKNMQDIVETETELSTIANSFLRLTRMLSFNEYLGIFDVIVMRDEIELRTETSELIKEWRGKIKSSPRKQQRMIGVLADMTEEFLQQRIPVEKIKQHAYILIWIYFGLSILSTFFREDFLNVRLIL